MYALSIAQAKFRPRSFIYLRLWLVSLLFALSIGGIILIYFSFFLDLKTLDQLKNMPAIRESIFLTRQGDVYYRFGQDLKSPIPLKKIPKKVIQAFLIAEDQDFYTHIGIQPFSIVRAFLQNTWYRQWNKRPIGASTITQQVIKNFILQGQAGFKRKLQEIFLAIKLERRWSKDDILEFYLNHIYMGRQVYGIDAAAKVYFHKKLDQLNLEEIAYLAALPKAPTNYQPHKLFYKGKTRRDWILKRMADRGVISQVQAEQAIQTPLDLYLSKDLKVKNYVILETQRLLKRLLKNSVYPASGMRINLTIDPFLQEVVEEILTQNLNRLSPSPDLLGAMVVIDAKSGDVLALSGGKDPERMEFNAATQAYRQVGSAFKPFVFAAAFEKGYDPDTLVEDEPITLALNRDQIYQPKNYKNKSYGLISLRQGFAKSCNQLTVRLSDLVGLKEIVDVAKRLGLPISSKPYYAMTLGAVELSLFQLTAAYAPFVNGGKKIGPSLIRRITDFDGKVLFDKASLYKGQKVLTNEVAMKMKSLLQEVVNSGTAKILNPLQKQFHIVLGGKTGSTNDFKDAWFVGFLEFPDGRIWLIGVFIGYAIPKSIGPEASGSKVALPIIKDFIENYFQKNKN